MPLLEEKPKIKICFHIFKTAKPDIELFHVWHLFDIRG